MSTFPDAERPDEEPQDDTPAVDAQDDTPAVEPQDDTPAVDAQDDTAPAEIDAQLQAQVEEALEGAFEAEIEESIETASATDEDVDLDWLPGDWYVIQTYSGYENKVKADLEHRVAAMHLEESIYEVIIPTEESTELKAGKKVKLQRKVFPGYLLVRCELDDQAWIAVRNTPGVTGFVGGSSVSHRPLPLTKKEVEGILQRGKEAEKGGAATPAAAPKRSMWNRDDPVRVTAGPFANFQGVVSEVDNDKEKVRVLVNIFGRETPVELGFDQIAKV